MGYRINSNTTDFFEKNGVNISIRGEGHYKGKLLNSNEIASIVLDQSNFYSMSEVLRNINGFYSAVVSNKKGEKLLAVDHVSSMPLFYKKDGSWGTHVFEFINSGDKPLDSSVAAFLKTGWTIEDSTLFPNVYQVIAGEHIIINPDETIEKIESFSHKHNYRLTELDDKKIKSLLWKASNGFTDRLLEFANGRPIVVPLSGGYDSRYIAAMLKHAKAENVILVSYGRKDSFEVATARKVAKHLGYRWIMIDYNPEFLRKYFITSKIKDFCINVSGGTSLPHVQEYAMLSWLKEEGKIDNDSIFVPGFCGDLLGGSYIPNEVKEESGEKLIKLGIDNYIYKKLFYYENELTSKQINVINNELNILFKDISIEDKEHFCSEFESWFTRHKVSKFIINSVRSYEYFGYQWYLPLWDKELINLWYDVSLNSRINKDLFDNFLLKDVFSPLGIDFKKEHAWLLSGVLGKVRPFIPSIFKGFLRNIFYNILHSYSGKKYYGQNNSSIISEWFVSQLKIENGNILRASHDTNSIKAIWFISSLDSLITSNAVSKQHSQ